MKRMYLRCINAVVSVALAAVLIAVQAPGACAKGHDNNGHGRGNQRSQAGPRDHSNNSQRGGPGQEPGKSWQSHGNNGHGRGNYQRPVAAQDHSNNGRHNGWSQGPGKSWQSHGDNRHQWHQSYNPQPVGYPYQRRYHQSYISNGAKYYWEGNNEWVLYISSGERRRYYGTPNEYKYYSFGGFEWVMNLQTGHRQRLGDSGNGYSYYTYHGDPYRMDHRTGLRVRISLSL